MCNNGKWGYINNCGTWIVQPFYDAVALFNDGLAVVKNACGSGFLDPSGAEVIPCQYLDAMGFLNGLAPVMFRENKNAKPVWKFISKNNKQVCSTVYDFAGNHWDGFARVNLGGKWGYVDEKCHTAVECQFDWAGDFCDGLAKVQIIEKNLKTIYINKLGESAFSQEFENGEDFSHGYAAVYIDKKWGFIDSKGVMISQFKWEEVGEFAEGLAPVLENGYWKYIDGGGNLAFSQKFQEAKSFSEGLAGVKLDHKWGFISLSGDLVIEPKFGMVDDFINGLAPVNFNGQFCYVNTSGAVVAP